MTRNANRVLFRVTMFSVAALCLLCAPLAAMPEEPTIQTFHARAMQSDATADAVGVNTHLNYRGSIYDAHYEDIIKPRLIELGTRHIRDHIARPGDGNPANARYEELAIRHGIRLLLIHHDGGADLQWSLNEVKRMNAIAPDQPVVEMIEPANERDNGWKQDWPRLCKHLQSVWMNYQSDPATRDLPIAGPSFANTKESAKRMAAACTGAAQWMDYGNLHDYSGLYPESPLAGGWGISLDEAIECYRALCGSVPLISSETGFKLSEGGSGHPSVSERAAAKYSPRQVLVRLQRGYKRVYFYQLINNSEDFGLLNDDGSPRRQFTALKNLIALFNDPGPPFNPDELAYSLEGDLNDVHHLLFQRRNGDFLLALWLGVNGATASSGDRWAHNLDLEPSERPIHITFPREFAHAAAYRPSFDSKEEGGSGQTPAQRWIHADEVDVNIPDHVVVLELRFAD
ncbi:MAG: hypothetical protein GC154_16180 [bacterium]|nr:hypothetical protein [bacterium]